MLKDLDNTEKPAKKITRIVALVDNSVFGMVAAEHGLKFAEIFKAELCLIKSNKEADLDEIQKHLTTKNSEVSIFHRDVKKLYHKDFYAVLEEINAIILVLGASRIKGLAAFTHKTALKLIIKSRIPCVVTGTKNPIENAYKNILLPLDSHQQSKEKSLWAGYFSRFYQATVHVLLTAYKDEYLKNRLYENTKFTEKLYENLEIKYKKHFVAEVKDDIDIFSLEFAPSVEASLVLIMTTKFFTIFDYIFGTQELKIIANDSDLPVMLINRRDDLYVLCT